MPKTLDELRKSAIHKDLRTPKYRKRVEKDKSKEIPRKAKHKQAVNEGPPNRVMARELQRKKSVTKEMTFNSEKEAREFVADNGGKGRVTTFKLGPRKKPITKYKAIIYEAAPTNSTGPAIPGSGDTGDVWMTKKQQKKFANTNCYEVSSDTYAKCIQGKKKYKHWKSFVGEDDTGHEIRTYARSNPDSPIIIQDQKTGAMVYLRYGKKK